MMIKNSDILEKWQKEQRETESSDYSKNLQIYAEMFKEALLLKALPLKNPLE
ncbi:hypothetical protein GWN26_02260 [Candidatus Saccharibacteria bacterium]|nr:hypothetical protein [Candidatus Saccharibacteria bacterium]NIV03303.1 hypothetical protein [Calditrichia bacterium]NIV71477.1 hypothetical protein [Calditrichia bacterium]NIV98025.1 hypothetical protein [Candidatus Saccharibacteria bacterium]NIW78315.1 hypothetical protein [Calditrichia bacterium]